MSEVAACRFSAVPSHVTRCLYSPERLLLPRITTRVVVPERFATEDTCHYALSALLLHWGPTASSGHYQAARKDGRGNWYLYNDNTRTPIANLREFLSSAGSQVYKVGESGSLRPALIPS